MTPNFWSLLIRRAGKSTEKPNCLGVVANTVLACEVKLGFPILDMHRIVITSFNVWAFSVIWCFFFRCSDKAFSNLSRMYENNDPDKFYDEIVMPYKGSLEDWYVSHQNIVSYFSLISLTIWVVLGFSSGLVWKLFKDLPPLPEELDKWF